jgi:hypothetical protein
LAVDDHDMRPLVEGRRRQARVVIPTGNGCDAATEALIVQDDAAVVAAVVGAYEPTKSAGDREQLEPDLDGAISQLGWVDVDEQFGSLPAADAQRFGAIDAADICAPVKGVPALVGSITEVYSIRQRRRRGRRR